MNNRLLYEAKCKRIYIPLSSLQAILNSFFIVINTFLLSSIVNSVFILRQNIMYLKYYLLFFILNAAMKLILGFILENLIKKISEDIKDDIIHSLFNKILSSSPHKVKEQNSGGLMNILTAGGENIILYYSQYLPQFITSIITPIIICITVAFKDGISALLLIITYPIVPLFMALIGYKSKEKNQEQWKTLTTLSSHFLDMLQGLRTLKAFGRSRLQEEKVYKISEAYRKSTMEVLKVSFLSALVLETSATISTAIVAVNLGLRLVYSKIDFFTAFFILIITPEFYLPLRQLGTKFHSSLNGQIAIEKIDALKLNLSDSKENRNYTEGIYFTENLDNIMISDLSFFHGEKEALNGISFEIRANERLSIIGGSGSGKSTLINILSGLLVPPDNTVFINGKDLNCLNKADYLNRIALVPQFPHIFNLSLRENILLGNEMTDQELYNLCKITRVDEFAQKFENCYETIIGDGEEIDLSGGERQRIALARALAKKADIFIFDEPTSALDSDTEELLSNIFNNVLKDKTVIIAAHRLNTIKGADRIMVLGDGSLIESGTHEELLRKKGMYFNMLNTAGVIL